MLKWMEKRLWNYTVSKDLKRFLRELSGLSQLKLSRIFLDTADYVVALEQSGTAEAFSHGSAIESAISGNLNPELAFQLYFKARKERQKVEALNIKNGTLSLNVSFLSFIMAAAASCYGKYEPSNIHQAQFAEIGKFFVITKDQLDDYFDLGIDEMKFENGFSKIDKDYDLIKSHANLYRIEVSWRWV